MRRCRWVGLLVLIAGVTGALATAQTDARSHAKRAKTLNDTLETVRLTDGFENIGGIHRRCREHVAGECCISGRT
jgi:hypothetical protein